MGGELINDAEGQRARIIADRYAQNVANYDPGFIGEYRTLFFDSKIKGASPVYYKYSGQPMADEEFSGNRNWLIRKMSKTLENERRAWMLINGDTDMIRRLNLSKKEINHIRRRGLLIFYYEPLFLVDGQANWVPIKNKTSEFYCPELEWVREFYQRYEKKFKITIALCDRDYEGKLKKKYPEFHFITADSFLLCTLDQSKAGFFSTPYYKQIFSAAPKTVETLTHFVEHQFKAASSRVACLNFRYDPIRHLICAYIYGRGYNKDAAVTFYHRLNVNHLLESLTFDPTQWAQWPTIELGLKKLDEVIPLSMNIENPTAVDPIEYPIPYLLKNANVLTDEQRPKFHGWNLSQPFIVFANESRVQTPFACITEKTIVPIFAMKPFVVGGATGAIKYLHELGIQTFGDYWDESYDLIEDHGERTQCLLKLIDVFYALDNYDLAQLKAKLVPIVVKNSIHSYFHMKSVIMQQVELSQPKRSIFNLEAWL